MYASAALANEILYSAVQAAESGGEDLLPQLDALAAPIYVTDPDGVVTHFNQACIGFAGRTPAVGKDRWCVSWKLYTDQGEFLPHDQCPMALAIRDKTAIRGVTAVAERPDGRRVMFMPFPTPILDGDGELLGAVNMLLDITDLRQIAELRQEAHRCRWLANSFCDPKTNDTLNLMAAEYEAKASDLERSSCSIV